MNKPLAQYTYRELERLTGIDKAVWSRWRNGKQSPTLDSLKEVAIALGYTDPKKFVINFMEWQDSTL